MQRIEMEASMTKKFLVLALGAALLLSLGCNSSVEQGELTQHNFPIINGGIPPETGVFPAVVSLHQFDGTYVSTNIFCSGTLVAPDVVLTAAHCLNVGRRKPVTMSPDAVAIGFGQNPTTATADREFYPVSETWMHPAYNATALTDDIAMLRLALPNNDVTPVPFLPAALGFSAADEGMALDFAGYGQDEDGNYNEKLHFVGELDHIQSAGQIYYLQPDGGPCFGDSGGPAFVNRNGTTYVAGMTSYGDSYCSQYGVSTRADAYEDLINDFVGVVVEPFCGDNSCNNGETCETCAAYCGACPVDPFCGDGNCDAGEDCGNCEADCGACPVDPFCGDGNCDAGEDCASCEADCGICQTCGAKGDPCSSGTECCSGLCHPRKHTCK